jgi:hypothetical protein
MKPNTAGGTAKVLLDVVEAWVAGTPVHVQVQCSALAPVTANRATDRTHQAVVRYLWRVDGRRAPMLTA